MWRLGSRLRNTIGKKESSTCEDDNHSKQDLRVDRGSVEHTITRRMMKRVNLHFWQHNRLLNPFAYKNCSRRTKNTSCLNKAVVSSKLSVLFVIDSKRSPRAKMLSMEEQRIKRRDNGNQHTNCVGKRILGLLLLGHDLVHGRRDSSRVHGVLWASHLPVSTYHVLLHHRTKVLVHTVLSGNHHGVRVGGKEILGQSVEEELGSGHLEVSV